MEYLHIFSGIDLGHVRYDRHVFPPGDVDLEFRLERWLVKAGKRFSGIRRLELGCRDPSGKRK